MGDDESERVPEVLSALAEGFSRQNRIASSYWIALAIVSTLSLMPIPSGNSIPLPVFASVSVSTCDFYPFSFLLISILVIGYGSSNVQVTRTRRPAQKYLDARAKSRKNYIIPETIHSQDLFDSITTPSLNRVAPLAQILMGKFQFYPEAKSRSVCRSVLGALYFILLRAVAILVIEAFPGYALISSFLKGNLALGASRPWGVPVFFFRIVGIAGSLILLQLFVLDVIYGVRAVGRICVGMRGTAKAQDKAE